MRPNYLTLAHIEDAVSKTGLMIRGGFHPVADDHVPGDPLTLILLGNAGPGLWQRFDPVQQSEPEPLDAWTRRTGNDIAEIFGAHALFPFEGPPYLPFQRWAQRCESVFPSPIGPLIHPTFGLWHAYRGALAFDAKLDLPTKDDQPHPCETCTDQPCLSTCPVGAFSPDSYNVPACVEFITSDAGNDCLERGCAARRACPVGRDFIYDRAQATFHMRAFAGSNGLSE